MAAFGDVNEELCHCINTSCNVFFVLKSWNSLICFPHYSAGLFLFSLQLI